MKNKKCYDKRIRNSIISFIIIAFIFCGTATISIAIGTPTVSTLYASDIGETSAVLKGNLEDLGGASICEIWFEYGTTTSYGTSTPHKTNSHPQIFACFWSMFNQGTTYHFRACASNDAGTSYGYDQTFTTIVNEHPTATILSPVEGNQYKETIMVDFNGQGFDPDGHITNCRWYDNNHFLSDVQIFSSYLSYGTHDIQFRVLDDDGAWSDWDHVEIYVSPQPPEITLFKSSKTTVGENEEFTLSWTTEYADHCDLYGNEQYLGNFEANYETEPLNIGETTTFRLVTNGVGIDESTLVVQYGTGGDDDIMPIAGDSNMLLILLLIIGIGIVAGIYLIQRSGKNTKKNGTKR